MWGSRSDREEKAVVRKDDFRMEKFQARWLDFFPELPAGHLHRNIL